MSGRTKPRIDETIERDEAAMDDLQDAFKMLMQDGSERPRSENREPARDELKGKWKLLRST